VKSLDYGIESNYPLINIFGKVYSPLNSPITGSQANLAPYGLDSKDKYTLKTGEKLDLGKDYSLQVKQMDVDSKIVWLEFDKGGKYVADSIIATDSGDHTWTCTLNNIQGVNNVPVLKVHVNQILGNTVQIDGIWLIDYTNAKTLKVGSKLGGYTLTKINNGVGLSNLGSLVFEDKVYAYISHASFEPDSAADHTVSILDVAANKVTANVTVGRNPLGVAVSPDGSKVYAANSKDNTVSVIDTATNTVIATIPVGTYPEGVAVSPDGTKVYVTNSESNNVYVIDTATNKVTATVVVGINPIVVAIHPDGTKLYVKNGDGTLSVINTANNIVTAIVKIDKGSNSNAIAVSPDGKKLYALYQDRDNSGFYGGVAVIDTVTNTVTTTIKIVSISMGVGPSGLVVSPDGKNVYVTNTGNSNVYVIDTTTNPFSNSRSK
jgi:S-layer protein (TIGR01567 family)